MNPMQLPIRVAIIGLGHIGKFHIKAISQFDEVKLISVCDRQPEFISFVPEHIKFYTNYQELLREGGIDTVIIATPNNTHYFIARNVLAAGYNLILEKPAAENMQELNELERAANKNGCKIYYAFHAASAFDVDWFAEYYSREEIREEFGPVTGFRSRFYDPYITAGSLLPEAEGLQNCWMDSGINALSVIQLFVDLSSANIENVSAAINHHANPPFLQCHSELVYSVNGNDRSGSGVIDTNWTTGRNHKSTILHFGQSSNKIVIDHTNQTVSRTEPNGSSIILADCSDNNHRLYNHYIGVFRDFLNHYKSGVMNGEKSIMTHKLLFDAILRLNWPL